MSDKAEVNQCESAEYPERTVVLGGYLLLTVVTFGLVGNFLCITVLIRRYLANSVFAFYLKSLCITDTITLTSAFFMIVLPILAGQCGLSYSGLDVIQHLMLIFYPIGVMVEGASAYITSSISVVRLISVRFPFVTRNFVECHVAEKLIGSIVVLVCLFNIPRTMEIGLFPCQVNNTHTEAIEEGNFALLGDFPNISYVANETHWNIGITSLRQNPIYKQVYLSYINTTVMFVIPFVTIVFCSICITISLVSSYKTASRLRSNSVTNIQQDNTTTKLILILCVSFMCSQSLPFLINIMEATGTVRDEHPEAFSILVDIANILTATKASSNFLFYLMFNRTFRKNATESLFSMLLKTHKFQRALLAPDARIDDDL